MSRVHSHSGAPRRRAHSVRAVRRQRARRRHRSPRGLGTDAGAGGPGTAGLRHRGMWERPLSRGRAIAASVSNGCASTITDRDRSGGGAASPVRTRDRVATWDDGRTPYAKEQSELRRSDVHPAGADPELLHHRAHRPRQVDAGRPDAAAHRRGRGAPDARPVPRPDGHRARARHHDQGAERAAAVAGRRAGPRPAPDRHPRPRRLHLRGLPGAGGVRGRDPAGRRRAGDRGADAGQPLPGAGEGPHDHPGAQQDRPAGRRPGPLRRRDRPHHRLRRRRRAAGQREDRASVCASCSTRSSGRCRPPHGRRRRARPAR